MFHRSNHVGAGRSRRLGRHHRREPAAGRAHRAHRLGELREPGGAGGAGLAAHQQVRRGLSRQALLRRLRVRRRRRAARASTARRSSSTPTSPTCSRIRVRRRTRRCTSAMLKPGDTILGMSLAARRPPDARLAGQHLAASCSTSSPTASIARRSSSTTTRRERLAHEHKPKLDRRRRVGLLARHRLEALPRTSPTSVGALLMVDMAHYAGLDRRRPLSVARGHRRLRHQHHAQDAARPARRRDPRAGRAREDDQLRRSSRACRAGR